MLETVWILVVVIHLSNFGVQSVMFSKKDSVQSGMFSKQDCVQSVMFSK